MPSRSREARRALREEGLHPFPCARRAGGPPQGPRLKREALLERSAVPLVDAALEEPDRTRRTSGEALGHVVRALLEELRGNDLVDESQIAGIVRREAPPFHHEAQGPRRSHQSR